jgi:hypothetical protein
MMTDVTYLGGMADPNLAWNGRRRYLQHSGL